MPVIETKYGVGDVVWRAGITTESRAHQCPDCLGEKKWSCRSPAGGEFEIPCPRCGDVYQSDRALSLKYAWWVPTTERLTIGSIQAGVGNPDSYDYGNRYMCLETGVGSGTVYGEADLFPTKEEALAAAQAKADLNNADASGWVAKQYEGSLKFSDYQLKDALVKSAESRAWSANYRLQTLLQDLAEAETLDEARSIAGHLTDQSGVA
jgi:hypothetical protein